MKKLILLLVLLYGCSKDNTTTPINPPTINNGDSVSIIADFKYTCPFKYLRWSIYLPSLNGHTVGCDCQPGTEGGYTTQTHMEWHFNVGIADTLVYSNIQIYLDTTEPWQGEVRDSCTITIWCSHHYTIFTGNQLVGVDFQQLFCD